MAGTGGWAIVRCETVDRAEVEAVKAVEAADAVDAVDAVDDPWEGCGGGCSACHEGRFDGGNGVRTSYAVQRLFRYG